MEIPLQLKEHGGERTKDVSLCSSICASLSLPLSACRTETERTAPAEQYSAEAVRSVSQDRTGQDMCDSCPAT